MRKIVTNSGREVEKEKSSWLDVKTVARVEVTSEDSRYPIESVFDEGGLGWRSAETGEQTIRLVFDQPQRIQLVHRLISGRHTAVGDFADFQGASDEHTWSRT